MIGPDEGNIRELLRLGRIGLEQGYWQEADAYYRQVLELAPGHPVALLGRARAVRDPREALACAQEALARRPGSREAQLLCAELERRAASDAASARPDVPSHVREDQGERERNDGRRGARLRVAFVAGVAVLVLGLSAGGWYVASQRSSGRETQVNDVLQPLAAEEGDETAQSDLVAVTQSEGLLLRAERATALVLALDLASGQVSRGSGSVVSADGLVVTNQHVVEVASADGLAFVGLTEDVREPPSEWYLAAVVATDAVRDLAVLRIRWHADGEAYSPTELQTVVFGEAEGLALGQDLIGLGYPALGGDTLTLTRGSMAGFVRDEHGVELGKTDSELLPGSSGGAVLDANGRLVGVITAAQADYRTQGRLGYFVLLDAEDVLLQRAVSATVPDVDVRAAAAAFQAEM